jgi:hypothetical protein
VRYFLSPEAEEELAEAVAFYSERASETVASAFLSEFTRVARLVAINQRRRPGYWRNRK